MQRIKQNIRTLILLNMVSAIMLLLSAPVSAQCPQLYDGNGNLSSNPYWINCLPGNYTVYVQANQNVGPYTINWGDGTPVQSGASLIPPAALTHTYLAAIDTFVITFTEISTGCVITGVVVMERTPSASIQIPMGSPVYGCTPAIFNFLNSSTNVSETTVFTWDFGDGSPIQTHNYTNAGQIVSHTYLPGTANCNITVTLTAENYCNLGTPSSASYYPIQVWDIDDADITASNTLLCYPDTQVLFTNTTDRNCYAYGNTAQRYEFWNFGNYWGFGHDSIVGWRPWSPPMWGAIPIAYPGIGTYNVMLIDSSYCGVDTAYIVVNIVPRPHAAFSMNPNPVCAGQNVTFTNLTTGGANSYLWTFGNGNTSTAANPPTQVYNTAGTYNVILEVNITGGTASCYDRDTMVLVVLPAPDAAFTQSGTQACDSMTVVFTNTSSSSSPIVSYAWDFDNGNYSSVANPPSQFYGSPGVYDVQLAVTSLNGCSDHVHHSVTIRPSPVADFSAANVCLGETAVFTDLSTISTGTITSWNWVFGNGQTSTQQNPTTVYTSTGPVDIILTVATNWCSDSDTLSINIEPLPVPSFVPSVTQGCPPLQITFNNTTTNGSTYYWSFGDGTFSTDTTPQHIFYNMSSVDVVYHIKMVASSTFGCKDSITQDIVVHPMPASAFSHNALPGCSPVTVQFTNASVGYTSQIWIFGDGSPPDSSSNPSHTFVNDTTFILFFNVQLIAISANGCRDTSSQFITVYPNPQYTFTVSPDTACNPVFAQLAAVPGGVQYHWIFGDGTSVIGGPNIVHLYTNTSQQDTTYNITLITTSFFSCTDTSYGSILIHPKPVANFDIVTTSGCTPFAATFNQLSTGATQYQWRFGDGTFSASSSPVVTHTYVNSISTPSTYNVRLIVWNAYGCSDTIVKLVTVNPEVLANFDSDTSGCSPLLIDFTDQSIGAGSYSWTFGDGSTSNLENPVHSFVNSSYHDTIYHVMLVATSIYGCSDTAQQNVYVWATPVAQFSVSPLLQTFPATNVTIDNLSPGSGWNYNWDFGDGTTTSLNEPISHIYTAWGTYPITLIVAGTHCSDTLSQSIQIVPPRPVADFDSSASGCAPLTVSFSNHSQYADSYIWDFGDGMTSTDFEPIHVYQNPGVYIVQLIAFGDGGVDTIANVTITVFVIPHAFFTLAPNVVYLPDQPVHCYDLSENAVTWFWDFGDGSTSTEQNPTHVYTEVGVYDISLLVTSSGGCPSYYILQEAVSAQSSGEILFPNAFTPSNSGPTGGYYSPNDYSNDVFHPIFKGVSEYRLSIFNRWGELIFESKDVNIGWDGYYRDVECKPDVYVWKAEGRFADGRAFMKAGDITLIR
ncbi:MAG: PKD domain-containing protein [Bacteroidota bacterium]